VLEQDAREHGVDLATHLRRLAGERARALRRPRIRAESRVVGERVRADAEARDFYFFAGHPNPEI
jgi:hypothetical protein